MASDIRRVGGNPLPPQKPLLTYNPSDDGKQQTGLIVVPKDPVQEVKPIDYGVHPDLFVGLRNAVFPIGGIRKYIDWLKTKSGDSVTERAMNALEADNSLTDSIDDLAKEYSKSALNLISVLKSMLFRDIAFEDKSAIVKIFACLERENELLSEFIVPSLERKKELPNMETNNSFCLEILSLQSDSTLKRIIESINYKNIKNTDDFAISLIKIKEPYFILDALISHLRSLAALESNEVNNVADRDKIEKIALKILQTMDESGSMKLTKEHLVTLYTMSTSAEIGKELSDLQVKHHEPDAPLVFKSQFLDKSDETSLGRRRRFFALGHFAQYSGAYGASILKDFIKEEKDSFLVGSACYSLANFCDIDGKRTLASLISEDVRLGRPSLALAALTQMVKFGEPYLAIYKAVLAREFKKGNDLREAYLNLSGVETCSIHRESNGVTVFDLDDGFKPDLVVDLVSNVGVEQFLKWIAHGDGKETRYIENIKCNSRDVLNLAWETNKEKMSGLILEAVSLGSGDTMPLLNELVGLGNLGKTA